MSPSPAPSLGLVATLAWGVVGLLATFCYPVIGRVTSWIGIPFPFPKSAELLPLSHILLVLVVLAAIGTARKPILAYLALTPPRPGSMVRAVGLGVLAYIMLAAIYAGINVLKAALGSAPMVNSPGALTEAHSDFGTLATILSLGLAMVVAAPIAEEIFYRGFLYRGLATPLGAVGAIAVTSILFGLVHAPGFGWERVVGTGLIGALLGALRWRTDSTVVTIIVHGVTNLIGWMVLAGMIAAGSAG
jgi:membrane protease YdiL (CAAX protease family)